MLRYFEGTVNKVKGSELHTNYLKTLVVGYHPRCSRKEEVPIICPKTLPNRSRLPLSGECPMSCGRSSKTNPQRARSTKEHRSSAHRPTPSPRCDHLQKDRKSTRLNSS